jgi:hypothetical protein
MNKLTPQLISLLFLMLATSVNAQTTQQDITVTVRPSFTVEEKVANETKEKQLRREADEKMAAEASARLAATSPKNLLSSARTITTWSATDFFDEVQLQNALRKQKDFEALNLAIVDSSTANNYSDIVIKIDRPLFTYTFTYQITNRSNGLVLATGKITAFDGNAAAPQLATRILDDIKAARKVSTK